MSPLQWRRSVAIVVGTCLSYLAASLILDVRQDQGDVILAFTDNHGVHSGDVPVALAWLIGMIGCVWFATHDPDR